MTKTIERPDSSNIKEVKYDDATKKLYVTFNAGGIYEYSGVPEETFEKFRDVESAGKYFHAAVKNNYAYKKVASGFGG